MITPEQRQQFEEQGYVVLDGYLAGPELDAGAASLPDLFPTADGFHSKKDRRRKRFIGNQFAGIEQFPFTAQPLNQLALSHRVIELAQTLLGDDDLRVYTGEAWAKYTGATDYEQKFHLDFMNHTVLVPSEDPRFRQLEVFIYLNDVDRGLGPTAVVGKQHTLDLPVWPNWRDRALSPELYEIEEYAVGAAGTVLAYTTSTLHRGTNMTKPGGARFTLHLNFRRADVEWAQRIGWAEKSFDTEWAQFVAAASVEQLRLFGFPPPGHPFWTDETCGRIVQRYPGFDPTPWR